MGRYGDMATGSARRQDDGTGDGIGRGRSWRRQRDQGILRWENMKKNFSSKDLQDIDYYSCFFMITFTMINRLKEKRPIYINFCFLFPWTASGPRALRYGPSRPLTGMYGPFRALTGSYGPLRPPVPYEPLRALRALTGPPTDFYGVTGPRAWPTGPQAHGPMGLGKGS